MTRYTVTAVLILASAFIPCSFLHAQSITGYSTIYKGNPENACPPGTPPPPPGRPTPEIAYPVGFGPCGGRGYLDLDAYAMSMTEEDYIASLYYQVSQPTAEFYGDTQLNFGASVPNSSTTSSSTLLQYTYPDLVSDGLYSEVTWHEVTFYYIASTGLYYDPYGYSGAGSGFTNGSMDGDQGSGYWFNVNVYGTYIAVATAILGYTSASFIHNSPPDASASNPAAHAYSVLFQAYIPQNNVLAPYIPPPFCGADNYVGLPIGHFQGDDRGITSDLGSYRAFQQVTLGLNGSTPPSKGIQDTGVTSVYADDAIVGRIISAQAQQDTIGGDCHYLINRGKASVLTLTTPMATGQGGPTPNTTLSGFVGNPLSISGTIAWNAQLTLTQSSPTSTNVSGTFQHECFPAYQLNVGPSLVGSYTPPVDPSIFYILGCLGGVGEATDPISTLLYTAP